MNVAYECMSSDTYSSLSTQAMHVYINLFSKAQLTDNADFGIGTAEILEMLRKARVEAQLGSLAVSNKIEASTSQSESPKNSDRTKQVILLSIYQYATGTVKLQTKLIKFLSSVAS